MTDNSTDMKALAKTLSDSYSALLQYSTLPQDSYSDHLPLSWFTPALLETLLALSDRRPAIGATTAIYTLWTVWVRRLSGSPDTYLSIEPQLAKVLTKLEEALLSPSTTPITIRKESLIGLVALAGRAPKSFPDSRMMDALTRAVAAQAAVHSDGAEAFSETMDAGVAHCLAETSLMNVFEFEHCERLLEGYVAFAAQRSTDGAAAAMTVLQHVVDVRSQLKPQTRADADLTVLIELVVKERQGPLAVQLVWLAILAGAVRMFQFTKEKSKKMDALHEQMNKELIGRFGELASQVMAKESAYDLADNQNIVAYVAGQCLPNLLTKSINAKDMDHKSILRVLMSCLLTSKHIWNGGQIISQLENTQECVDKLNQLANGLVYKDIGRISRAIGVSLDRLVSDKKIGEVYRPLIDKFNLIYFFRLVGFSYNVFIDWDRFLREHPEKDGDGGMVFFFSPEAHVLKGLNTEVWQMFKTMLFAFTALTVDQTHPTAMLSQLQLSRLTFFTNLTEQVMAYIDDNVLEQDILPVIYPILKWRKPESKDMYESAHAATLAVFSAKKDISREVSGIYAKILIDSFPEPMSLHQLRFAYTTMVHSLCLMDDAISWLASNSLLDKVHRLEGDDKNLVLLSEYGTVLVDLLKPLSLGPFFGQLLQEVENLVLQPIFTPDTRQAMLKVIFETVSGTGISDMRRVDAVGWFLALKRKVTATTRKAQHPSNNVGV
ncbi:hypothetical protein BX666DRAFT_1858328 [Dichotomocladium elegans]|nr:hypothetical protein BX666DRAFT_1858328 [Dichotomocladium elegans]